MIQLVTPRQPEVQMVRPKPIVHPPAPIIAPAEVRKKYPAYGKSLYLNRVGGFHPARAFVVFGDDWKRANETKQKEAAAKFDGVTPYTVEWLQRCGWPVMALRPGEFMRGATQWNLVAGLWVHVLDQTNMEFMPDSRLLWMAAEIARVAGEVDIENGGGTYTLADLAHAYRYGQVGDFPWGFVPDWWTQELQELNDNNVKRWFGSAARFSKPVAKEW